MFKCYIKSVGLKYNVRKTKLLLTRDEKIHLRNVGPTKKWKEGKR